MFFEYLNKIMFSRGFFGLVKHYFGNFKNAIFEPETCHAEKMFFSSPLSEITKVIILYQLLLGFGAEI